MGFWGHNGARRTAVVTIFAAGLLLVWCGAMSLMADPAKPVRAGFQSYAQFAAAYGRIEVGRTPASRLAPLGFDASAAGAEAVSYLGMLERFMPRSSTGFDQLDPAVQSCLEARDRCKAYIFRLAESEDGEMLHPAGTAQTPVAEVTLFIQDGRVAYKSISGLPSVAARLNMGATATR